MEIRQLEPRDKIITFFSEIKGASVEAAIKDIARINASDCDYAEKCRQWAIENQQQTTSVTLSPIRFYLSTTGGTCYDGMALHDMIEASQTPVEVICTGKITSSVALSKTSYAYFNKQDTTYDAAVEQWKSEAKIKTYIERLSN